MGRALSSPSYISKNFGCGTDGIRGVQKMEVGIQQIRLNCNHCKRRFFYGGPTLVHGAPKAKSVTLRVKIVHCNKSCFQ